MPVRRNYIQKRHDCDVEVGFYLFLASKLGVRFMLQSL